MASKCFVMMPFRPELTFLFVFIKDLLATYFDIECERGDDRILTQPLLDKIRLMIDEADFVIADVSGRNPNVYYELGMAHASEKQVIIVTHDEVDEAPTDVRAFEFIKYTSDHDAFAAKLRGAVRSIVYDALYEAARTVFQRFCRDRGVVLPERSKQEFLDAVFVGMPAADIPDAERPCGGRREVGTLDPGASHEPGDRRRIRGVGGASVPEAVRTAGYGSACTVVPISAHS